MTTLIIEDDNIWQARFQITLERCEITNLLFAASVAEAQTILSNHTIDLIVADIMLEEEPIFELYKQNKKALSIPTIFITALPNNENYKNAEQVEHFLFLQKPFTLNTFKSAVNLLKNKKTINTETAAAIATETEVEADNLRITAVEIKRFYKLLGDDAMLEIFSLSKTETYILKQRWYQLRTFTDIAKDLNLSGARIQRLYPRIVNKIRTRIINNIPKYRDYLNFTNTKKNKLELLKNSVAIQKGNAKEFDLKTSIDSFEELSTKWKNVLWEKNIKSIEDLLQFSKKELSLFKKLGPFAVLEIEKVLIKYGFELRG